MRLAIILILAVIGGMACSANESILNSNRGNTNIAAAIPQPTPTVPAAQFTVGQLMERVSKVDDETFLYPCTLNMYSDEDRANLVKLRDQWMKKEQDRRYLVTQSTHCVCPDLCVLAVEDKQEQPPKNWRVLILDRTETPDLSMNYAWLTGNIDLNNGELTWVSSTPKIEFRDINGNSSYGCTIQRGNKPGKYTSICTDGNKNYPPLESR